MNAIVYLAGVGAGYIAIDLVKVVRDRYRVWKFKRALPGHLWWYKWGLTWTGIGLTEAMRTRCEPATATAEDLDRAAGLHAPKDN